MRDITTIDWQGDMTKVVESDPVKIPKQKVFFLQNGIEYDAGGKACNKLQVKHYYATVAQEAQETADAAIAKSQELQEAATQALAAAG